MDVKLQRLHAYELALSHSLKPEMGHVQWSSSLKKHLHPSPNQITMTSQACVLQPSWWRLLKCLLCFHTAPKKFTGKATTEAGRSKAVLVQNQFEDKCLSLLQKAYLGSILRQYRKSTQYVNRCNLEQILCKRECLHKRQLLFFFFIFASFCFLILQKNIIYSIFCWNATHNFATSRQRNIIGGI